MTEIHINGKNHPEISKLLLKLAQHLLNQGNCEIRRQGYYDESKKDCWYILESKTTGKVGYITTRTVDSNAYEEDRKRLSDELATDVDFWINQYPTDWDKKKEMPEDVRILEAVKVELVLEHLQNYANQSDLNTLVDFLIRNNFIGQDCPPVNEVPLPPFIMICDKRTPERGQLLYKFRGVNRNGRLNKYARHLLRKGEIFLSKPTEVNDVFDTRIRFMDASKENYSDKEIETYCLKHCWSAEKLLFTPGESDRARKQIQEDFDNPKYSSDIIRIFSLSAAWDNPAMWGYYASDGKGIAVGVQTAFQRPDGVSCDSSIEVEPGPIKENQKALWYGPESVYLPLVEMKYEDDMPTAVDYISDFRDFSSNRDIRNFFFTKAKCWEQEEEKRIFLPQNMLKNTNERFLHIAKGVIKEIIIGPNATDALIQQVKKLMKNKNAKCHGADLFRAVKSKSGKFELKKEPL